VSDGGALALLRTFCQWNVVLNKFCSQHDLTNIPIKSATEEKAYYTYAAKDIKENAVSNSYETTCMLSSKVRTLR